jgi:hypothetical protein
MFNASQHVLALTFSRFYDTLFVKDLFMHTTCMRISSLEFKRIDTEGKKEIVSRRTSAQATILIT